MKNGKTLLNIAVENNIKGIIDLLVSHGAIVNIKN